MEAQLRILGTAPAGASVRVSRQHNVGASFSEPLIVDEFTLASGTSVFERQIELAALKTNRISVAVAGGASEGDAVTLPEIVQGPVYDLGFILVEVHGGGSIEEVVTRQGGSSEDVTPSYGTWYRVRVEEGTEVEAVEAYLQDPDVAVAELSFPVSGGGTDASSSTTGTSEADTSDGSSVEDACVFVTRLPVDGLQALAVHTIELDGSVSDYASIAVASADPGRWPDLAAASMSLGGAPSWQSALAVVDAVCPPGGPAAQAIIDTHYLDTAWRTVYGGEVSLPSCDEGLLFKPGGGARDDRRRVAGSERCSTVAAASGQMAKRAGPAQKDLEAVLVRADVPVDAALALPALRPQRWGDVQRVLLLLWPEQLCAATVEFLRDHVEINQIHVVGGRAAVSDDVLTQLRAAIDRDLQIERYGGADRYATAVAVARGLLPDATGFLAFSSSQSHMALLAPRLVQLRDSVPVLYVDPDGPQSASVADYFRTNQPGVRLIGDLTMIPAQVTHELMTFLE